MNVVECDVPSGSVLGRELIERAYFRDSYRAPLSRREHGIIDIFFGIFAHHPLWMKLLPIIRNKPVMASAAAARRVFMSFLPNQTIYPLAEAIEALAQRAVVELMS